MSGAMTETAENSFEARRPSDAERATRIRIVEIAGDPDAIAARLAELELEWDIERVLEANAVAVSVIGTGIGLARRRGLLRLNLPAAVAAFLVQHAVRGARPPVSLLRRWGFRMAEEIERERYALLALSGAPRHAVEPRPRPSLLRSVTARGRRVLRR
jgi:hypothetical protein